MLDRKQEIYIIRKKGYWKDTKNFYEKCFGCSKKTGRLLLDNKIFCKKCLVEYIKPIIGEFSTYLLCESGRNCGNFGIISCEFFGENGSKNHYYCLDCFIADKRTTGH